MQNLSSSKKQRRSGLHGVRLLITGAAVAATLSLWVLFARQSMVSQALALKVDDPSQTLPPQDLTIVLPPMPTLIPQLAESSIQVSVPELPDIGTSVQPFQEGAKVLLGGQAPNVRRSAPVPFTTTRSSR